MATNYEIGRFLGSGSFAAVHLARDVRTRKHCAIKLVDATACQHRESNINANANDENENEMSLIIDLLKREIDVHSSVSSSRHPNVVSLLESFNFVNQATGNEMVALVMEHCSRGDLQGYMKRVQGERKQRNDRTTLSEEGTFLSANDIRHALSHVLCGLSFLHSRGIVHRDIKAPNIFLCPVQTTRSINNETTSSTTPKRDTQFSFSLLDCQLKLGDFGLAVQMEDTDDWSEAQRTFCGTPSCLAPEVVSQYIHNNISKSKGGVMKDGSAAATAAARPGGKSMDNRRTRKAEYYDSFLGVDASLLPTQQQQSQQSELVNKHAGYGQPADLWSTGCLLYTMIAGRNPFALPPKSASAENNQYPETTTTTTQTNLEKVKRMQQIIERVVRGDWSVPADVRMDDSLEMLLHQLLEEHPRKRGTARSILRHPFFQVVDSIVTSSSSSSATMEKNDSVMNGHQNARGMSRYNEKSNDVDMRDNTVEVSLIEQKSMKSEEMERNYQWKHHVQDAKVQSTIEETKYPKTAIEKRQQDSRIVKNSPVSTSDYRLKHVMKNANEQSSIVERQQNDPIVSAMSLQRPPQTKDKTEDRRRKGSAGIHFNNFSGNRDHIKRAHEGLAAAMAAAAVTSAELLRLRENDNHQSLPQDVRKMHSESVNETIISPVSAAADDGDAVLHYILDGRAGMMKLDSNQRFISRDELNSNLELLPYTDNANAKKRRAVRKYQLGDFDGVQLWFPAGMRPDINCRLSRLQNHSGSIKQFK